MIFSQPLCLYVGSHDRNRKQKRRKMRFVRGSIEEQVFVHNNKMLYLLELLVHLLLVARFSGNYVILVTQNFPTKKNNTNTRKLGHYTNSYNSVKSFVNMEMRGY